MHDVIAKLKGRLRHGLATQELLDRLARRGLVVYPYLVFQEFADSRFSIPPGLRTLTTRRLNGQDAAQVSAISVRPKSPEKIDERFRNNNIGVGAFDGDKLVAYTWCSLDHFGGIGQKEPRRSLANTEAYLYDAFTLPAYRGHALVPHLRTELYKILQAEGRTHIYSVSLWFNRSARRFKAKLGASAVEARLSVNLFDRFKRDFLLKRYETLPRPG